MSTDRGYPWLKVYTAHLDDLRFMRLSNAAKGLYFGVYLLAGKGDAGGLIVTGDDIATLEDIGFLLRTPSDEVDKLAAELIEAALLTKTEEGYSITRFQDEQGPSQATKRQEWNTRQKRKRARFNKSEDSVKAIEEDEEGHTMVTQESRVTVGSQADEAPQRSLSIEEFELIKTTWAQLIDQIRPQVDRAFFEAWIYPLKPLGWDGNNFQVSTNGAFHRDLLTARIGSMVNGKFPAVVNRSGVRVEFIEPR